MKDGSTFTCIFCSTISTKYIQFASPTTIFSHHEQISQARDEQSDSQLQDEYEMREKRRENSKLSFASDMACKILDDIEGKGLSMDQFTDCIRRGPMYSPVLQILLAHAVQDKAFAKTLQIGSLIYESLVDQNQEAWKLLLPMYELANRHDDPVLAQFGLPLGDLAHVLTEVEGFHCGYSLEPEDVLEAMGRAKLMSLYRFDIFKANLHPLPEELQEWYDEGCTSNEELETNR